MQALDGVMVLDLTRVLAGPWCTQLLADLGARVIKIERPGAGDDTRAWGPPYHQNPHDPARRVSAYFLAANRGKQSVCIDLGAPEGAALVRALAAQADILIENFKVGGLARHGLDYPTLSALNPRLIYASITGFGQTGPYASRPGYDFVIQGMGGLMSVTGEPDGEPMKAGVALADVMTGLYACNAILAALHARATTGHGQHIDLALLDVQIAAMANQALATLVTGRAPQRHGNAHPSIVPYETFHCADGVIALACGNDSQFRKLAVLLGDPALAQDPRFATNAARVGNRVDLVFTLCDKFASRTVADWLIELHAAGIPAGAINPMDQVFADPQVVAREMEGRIASPRYGEVPSVRCPIRMSDSDTIAALPPPDLGEHTDAVLQALVPDIDLAALRAAGIIG